MPHTYKRLKRQGRCIDEQRYVMEEHLGRELGCSEVVHHLDGDPLNNDLDNLEVMPLSKHSKMHLTGMKRGPMSEERKQTLQAIQLGKRHFHAKLSMEKAEEIRHRLAEGYTQTEIARNFGVHIRTIYRIKHGETWVKHDQAYVSIFGLEQDYQEEP